MCKELEDVKVVCFDLDETLYDQLEPFSLALQSENITIESSLIEPVFKKVRFYSDLLWKSYTNGKIDLDELRTERLIRSCNDFNLDLSKEKASLIQTAYEEQQNSIKPFSGVKSLIINLQKNNKLVGIITNGPVEHQLNKISALELHLLIPRNKIFISDEIGIAKPDKRIFQFVQEQLAVDSHQCCYIGDNWENDIAAPIEAGWKTIWFNYRNRDSETCHSPNKVIEDYKNFMI
ncbi:putative hydrolase of the HAD superfamily [Metabacillus crassostreae]|uniref:HAD family hydrolase n=1 Tax=Metabacillus crassostreae TaxID=929098 RepID=UPI00195A80AA|nr:HAD family hydrolase [Metabacillus crassostreae]MBM7603846.1 putative hydrolase of the HAD superfamily [Metabacillus crassostreae]